MRTASGRDCAGSLTRDDSQLRAVAIFSHCFTCTKDLKAIVRISRRLAELGIAVLRFDFTGLGDSSGSFSDSNFDTNCDDVRSAIDYIEREIGLPELLIGHSLGGAAMMTVAAEVESVRALATIASSLRQPSILLITCKKRIPTSWNLARAKLRLVVAPID